MKKEIIMYELEDAINNIFLKHQDELGITSGDIDIPQAIKLDELTEQTAELIIEVLQFEMMTNGLTECE